MTTEEAQEIYRDAWHSYMLCTDEEIKRELEDIMDSAQPFCVESRRPGPEWEAFIDTLPGYREFWDGFVCEGRKVMEEMLKRKGLS